MKTAEILIKEQIKAQTILVDDIIDRYFQETVIFSDEDPDYNLGITPDIKDFTELSF